MELKDKDKDRREWKLGEKKMMANLMVARTPKCLHGQEKKHLEAKRKGFISMHFFFRPCEVACLDPSSFSSLLINPATGKEKEFHWFGPAFWIEGHELRERWGCDENKKWRRALKKKIPEEQEEGAAAASCKPRLLLKRLARMLGRRQFYQKWMFPSSH